MRELRQSLSACCAAALIGVAVLLVGSADLSAQTKPKDATGKCKDGTYTTATTKSGACSSHGGVETWYADGKGVTEATKDAAKATGKATAGAAKTTGEVTKDASKATAGATEKGAKATGEATKDVSKATAGATEKGAKATGEAAKDAGKTTANETKKGVNAITGGAKTVKKPADAPAAAMGKCKDGTFSESKEQKGACSQHGGVAEWYQ
jgi:hypothetical protein